MTTRSSVRRLVALSALALLTVACGDDSSSESKSPAVDDTTAPSLVEGVVEQVGVIDNTFRPGSVEVAAGTEVEWTNEGRNDHNVLPVEGEGWGVEASDFAPDAVYRHRFTQPGTYHYYCSLHGTTTKGMVGTIVVK